MTGTHDAGVTADRGPGSGGTLGGSDTAVVPDAEADTPEDTSVSMGTQATITVGSPGVTVTLVTGTSLTVPAGALSATTMIGIETLPAGGATGTADTMPMLPATLNPSGAFVALTPHGQD